MVWDGDVRADQKRAGGSIFILGSRQAEVIVFGTAVDYDLGGRLDLHRQCRRERRGRRLGELDVVAERLIMISASAGPVS
jgi:hypothetical protein